MLKLIETQRNDAGLCIRRRAKTCSQWFMLGAVLYFVRYFQSWGMPQGIGMKYRR